MNVSLKEERICPECGKPYQCVPRWRPRHCPSCHGLRIAGYQHREPPPDAALEQSLAALRTITDAMDPLDDLAQRCVMAWLQERYVREWPHV